MIDHTEECSAGPEFIWNTLEVTGPREPLHAFLAAASGPGFIDWRPEWYSVYEHIYFGLMAAGAPSKLAATRLARKLSDRFWRQHGEARRTAELDPHRLPLDLNALIPIPQAVLRKGFRPSGVEWIREHWGVAMPLRQVSYAMEHRRQGLTLQPTAVFRFVSEDWSPWIALAAIRIRWAELRFTLIPSYLEPALRLQHKRQQATAAPRRRLSARNLQFDDAVRLTA